MSAEYDLGIFDDDGSWRMSPDQERSFNERRFNNNLVRWFGATTEETVMVVPYGGTESAAEEAATITPPSDAIALRIS